MKTVSISSKGQIAIPKTARTLLQIKQGDKLIFKIKDGKILLEPIIGIPRSEAWFWKKEIQQKIKKADENYKAGKFKRYKNVDMLIKNLKDE